MKHQQRLTKETTNLPQIVADRTISADMIKPKLETTLKKNEDMLWNGCVAHFGITFDD